MIHQLIPGLQVPFDTLVPGLEVRLTLEWVVGHLEELWRDADAVLDDYCVVGSFGISDAIKT